MRAGSLLFLPFFAAVSNGLVFTLPSTSLTAGAITLTYASEASDPAGELSIWLGPVGSNTRSFAAAAKVAATKVGETGTIKVDVSAEAADGDKWEFAAGPASTRPTGLFAKSDPFTVTVAGAGAVDNAANSASASASAQQSQSASASASASSARPSLLTPSAPPSQSSASAPASASSPASALPTNSETSAPPATETTAPPPPDANAALPSSPSSVVNSASPSTSPSSNPKTGSALGASAKSPAQPVGTIVGAIIGGLVGILLIILLLVVYLRKRAWRNRLEEDLEKYASDRNGNMFAPTANEYGGEKDREGAEGLNRAPSLGYGQGAAHAQMQNPYPYTTYGSGYAGGYNA